MRIPKKQIEVSLFILILMIATVPIAGTHSSLVVIGSSGAKLTGKIHGDEGVDSDGDQLFNYLKIGVEVNVNESGTYRVSISGLLSPNGTYISLSKDESMYLDVGLHAINVSLHGPTIYVSGLDPVNVSSIYLYGVANWTYLGSVLNVPLSREYLYTEFDPPGASLTGVISDVGQDTDSDDLYNYLEIGVEVNVIEAGTYEVSVESLQDSTFSYIWIYASSYPYLAVGKQTVNLQISGVAIRMSNLDPAYVSDINLRDANHTSIGRLSKVPLSKVYYHLDFEPPNAVLTGVIHDQGVDEDNDANFDNLQIGVEINVNESGYFSVNVGGLQTSNFTNINVYGSASGSFDPGLHVLNVSLFGPTIHASGLNPKYVSSIYLYTNYSSYLNNVPLSHEYSYTDFDPPGAVLTGAISDEGIDTDGDNQSNYLKVGIQINITEAGTYGIYVSGLLDTNRSSLYVYQSVWQYFDAGTHMVYFYFDAIRIHAARFNPKYIDYVSLQDGDYHYLGSLHDISLSQEYSYTQFDAPGAVLTRNIFEKKVDTDGDSFSNYLEVGVELNVTEPGTYRVQASGLLDVSYNYYISVYGYAEAFLTTGIQVLNVTLDGLTIYLSRRNPRHISSIYLSDRDGNNIDSIGNVPLSREYLFSEFEHPGAALTGTIFDQGIDTDGDSTFDYLRIGVEVNVTDPGRYYLSVSGLLDRDSRYIDVYGSNFTYLNVGLQQIIYVSLDGTKIYLSRLDPKYINHISLWDETYKYSDYLDRIPLAREYTYTEFDAPPAMLTGNVHSRGVDTDEDGTYDFLEIIVEVNVTEPGDYQVDVSELFEITPTKDRYYIDVWGSTSKHLDVGDGRTLNVSLYGPAIHVSHHNPTHVQSIHLSTSNQSVYQYLGSLYEVMLSRQYLYTEFDVPAVITGIVSDQGVDYDSDGYFDFLEVDVQVSVQDPGTYTVHASGLYDANQTHQVWDVQDYKEVYLDKGIHAIEFFFYGPPIRVAECNPAKVSYVSVSWHDNNYRTYYESRENVPLTKLYYYTQFDAPLTAVETKFVVYPDGRVGVEGALKYTDMWPQYNGPTGQGSFNLTSTQAAADLTVNLPPKIASQFPYNSTTADLLATYSNGLLNLGINSTMGLPSLYASQYPFNSTDGIINATYSNSTGILNVTVEGNSKLPPLASRQLPFNATDITVVGTYSQNALKGAITFSILDGFTFDDVDVGFTGTQTDLTLNGTVHVLFNVPLGGFMIRNETDLIQQIEQLKNLTIGENGAVWNITGGRLNVTNLDTSYVLNGVGASVTFEIDVQGDFIQALAYVLTRGRNTDLLSPVLSEAYQSMQSASFEMQYSHTTLEASVKLALSYDLKSLAEYVLSPPQGTTAYIVSSYYMSPALTQGDVISVELATSAGDVVADPTNGDIIAFYRPEYYPYSKEIVISRAINKTFVTFPSNTSGEGTWYFQTKGDNNWSPDYWSGPDTWNGMISSKLVIGRVVRRVPLLGFLLYPTVYPYLYGYPYYARGIPVPLPLWKAMFNSVQETSVQISYSSTTMQFAFRLTQVSNLKARMEEYAQELSESLPLGTPPEIKELIKSYVNTTYANVTSAQISLSYENGEIEFTGNAFLEGDPSAQLNHVKDFYFRLMGVTYSPYNITVPWQLSFINQTKIDLNNFETSARLTETSFECRMKGLTLMPPLDTVNTSQFKLQRLFNLTAPQYPWQQEFPGKYQKLTITIEAGNNGTHGVTLFRDPRTVPEPNATAPHQMIWYNQTLSSLKGLVFTISELNQYDLGWIVGRVFDADSSSPIVGASVAADDLIATTDSDGYYVISSVAPGDYNVTVTAIGYPTDSKSVYLDPGVTITANFEKTATPARSPVDVNMDGVVNILDVLVAAAAFGSGPGDPNWNPSVDFAQDNVIDIYDLVMIAIHFGERT